MKKVLSFILGTMVIYAMTLNVQASVLHEIKNERTITKGAQLITYNLLTSEGWRDLYMLKVDLNDDNVVVRPIESSTLGERDTILNLVNGSGAIAGVNSDFFDLATNSTPSFGPVIQDGYIKHAYNNILTTLGPKKNMGTLLIDNANNPLMDLYSVVLDIYADNNKIASAASYNNIPTSLSAPVILDRQFYVDTTKALSKLKDAYTVVVEDGVVTYISSLGEVLPIPVNGYVILMNENTLNTYSFNLQVGNFIEIDQTVELYGSLYDSVNSIKLGIGGGGIIMKDGQPYTQPSHKVSPNSKDPRTVVATTKDTNELLLIAIDGRGNSIGVTHEDLISLLKSYNIKDAMYFDGGGSTTLVAREHASKEVKLQNAPSGGAQRKVVNGLGIFTTNMPSTLDKLYIESKLDRTVIGEGIAFTVKAVDDNENPVDITSNSISWSVAGVSGIFTDNVFYPSSSGKALIIASSNGVEAVKEIQVSEKPMGIRIEPEIVQIDENSSKTVQVYGIDQDGFSVPMSPDKITWTSSDKNVTALGNKISTSKKTIAILTADYMGTKAKVQVVVGPAVVPVESFEENIGSWVASPKSIKGKVEPSRELKYHGDQALKMTYTFEKGKGKQVAYTVFSKPISITEEASHINMWVYAKGQKDGFKLQLTDKAGSTHYIELSSSLTHEGWKYLSVLLPDNVKLPAQVTRAYAYSDTVNETRTSAVYMDHVSITRGVKNIDQIKSENIFDPLYKQTLQAPKDPEYCINITSSTQRSEKISGNYQSTYVYQNEIQVSDHKDTKVIIVPTDLGGIRETNKDSWISIKNTLSQTNAKNIIFVMSKNPKTDFKDQREGKAFHDYLVSVRQQTAKNIFVVYMSDAEDVNLYDGIRYIRVNKKTTDAKYLQFKVVNQNIYYTFV